MSGRLGFLLVGGALAAAALGLGAVAGYQKLVADVANKAAAKAERQFSDTNEAIAMLRREISLLKTSPPALPAAQAGVTEMNSEPLNAKLAELSARLDRLDTAIGMEQNAQLEAGSAMEDSSEADYSEVAGYYSLDERMVHLQEYMAVDEVDPVWANEITDKVTGVIETFRSSTDQEADIELVNTECRSRLCRVETVAGDEGEQMDLDQQMLLNLSDDLPIKVTTQEFGDDGSVRTVHYFLREGTNLNDISPSSDSGG